MARKRILANELDQDLHTGARCAAGYDRDDAHSGQDKNITTPAPPLQRRHPLQNLRIDRLQQNPGVIRVILNQSIAPTCKRCHAMPAARS